MTEVDWNACTDPQAMLNYVTGKSEGPHAGGIVSGRQLRLFACACCRAVWDQLTDPRSRRAVEVAEEFADGLATASEFNSACVAAGNARKESPFCPWNEQTPDQDKDMAAMAVCELFQPSAGAAARHCSRLTVPPALQCRLLRDIVNPWWQPPGEVCWRCRGKGKLLDPGPYGYGPRSWDACDNCHGTGRIPPPWLTPRVREFTEVMYQQRDFSGVGALADMLEEEGCPTRVETVGPEILADSKEVCPYCSRWPANSPRGQNGWVKCQRWASEVPGDNHGRCGECNRLWKVGYDTVSVVTHKLHPLLQHLRQDGGACPCCKDADFEWNNLGVPYLTGTHSVARKHATARCACKGTRRLPAVHVRGCWAIDYLTGR